MSVRPIFIFTLPRSGSTLLQTMLASHSQISTVPEPWILIPPLYALRKQGVFSEYNQTMTWKAIDDFIHRLPAGRQSYLAGVRAFGMQLYGELAGSSRYFLDKTPRYHILSGDIMDAFPEGKFILLLRNPLAVLASMLETWQAIHLYRFDLYLGLQGLVSTLEGRSQQLYIVNYEDLVRDPEGKLLELTEYLDLDFQKSMMTAIKPAAADQGDFGYPTKRDGTLSGEYREISAGAVDKWKTVLGRSPLRKRFAANYLEWIGPERLGAMGYDYEELRSALESIPVSYEDLGSDLLRWGRGMISSLFETHLWREKFLDSFNHPVILPHQ